MTVQILNERQAEIDRRGPLLVEDGTNDVPFDPPLQVRRGQHMIVSVEGDVPWTIDIEGESLIRRLQVNVVEPEGGGT